MMHGVSRKCKKNNQNIIKVINFVANFVKPQIQMTGPSVSSKFWLG